MKKSISEKYIGCFQYKGGNDVKYHGFGCLRTNSNYYEGFFELGKLQNGFVKIKEGKKIYTGNMIDRKYEGFGKLELSYSTFVGEFKNSLYHGEGTWVDKSKSESYKGQWFRGKRHGTGTLVKIMGLKMTGLFRGNQFFQGLALRNSDGMKSAV